MKTQKIHFLFFKTFLIITSLLFLTAFNKSEVLNNSSKIINQLEQLAEKQSYFELRKIFKKQHSLLPEKDYLYFSAIIHNVFNNQIASNKDIEKLLNMGNISLADKRMNKIYQTKLLNHINLYEYEQAADCSLKILNKYRSQNTADEIDTLENEIKIWQALSSTAKQIITINKDTKMPMLKDKVGLSNVNIEFNGITKPFLFDTGANFSFIVKSLVEELKLKYIETDFYVTAATGSKVKSGIAIADEINIHGIIVKNVVFLVLDDKDMSFPQVDYYPNGAIGFPVLEAMQEMQFSQDDYIFIPKIPNKYTHNNFALDGLMPIVKVTYNNQDLSFNLDTGATKTSLYPEFFHQFKSEIESNNEPQILKAASAGGEVEFQGYSLNNLSFKIADSEAVLNIIRLHTEDIGGNKSHFYGNLGQDFIKKYNEMIISFVHSSISFR